MKPILYSVVLFSILSLNAKVFPNADSPFFYSEAGILEAILPGQTRLPIPETLFPASEKGKGGYGKASRKAEKYLSRSPAEWKSMIPEFSPAPLNNEHTDFNYGDQIVSRCGVCGFRPSYEYDIMKAPFELICRDRGIRFNELKCDGEEIRIDYSGRRYAVKYHITPHVKPLNSKEPGKIFYENFVAYERLKSLLGEEGKGVILELAQAYYESGDERFAAPVIALLERLGEVYPSYPLSGHSSLQPTPSREDFLKDVQKGSNPFHGWRGPARLAAGESNFRTPKEGVWFRNLCEAWMLVHSSSAWTEKSKKNVLEHLFREGSLLFRSYGIGPAVREKMTNGIGMYTPALYFLSVVLHDRSLLDGFSAILEDFLYNENFYDSLSTEGSNNYAGWISSFFSLFRISGFSTNPAYLRRHPFLSYAGGTTEKLQTLRQIRSMHGDGPNQAHHLRGILKNETGQELAASSETFGGFGISVLRGGKTGSRMEAFLSHDRVTGHAHDDMLGLQLFYRGIPVLSHFGDSRFANYLNMETNNQTAQKIRALYAPLRLDGWPATRTSWNFRYSTFSFTKNTLMIDEYLENQFETDYRGGFYGTRFAYGNPVSFSTGKNSLLQIAQAEGRDVNSHLIPAVRLFRRALLFLTVPDGRVLPIDMIRAAGGHRHTLLFHSAGKEVESTLPDGRKYPTLADAFTDPEVDLQELKIPMLDLLKRPEQLRNVRFGERVGSSWSHHWILDYDRYASRTRPLREKNARIHWKLHGFLSGEAKSIRASGPFPAIIDETVDGRRIRGMVEFADCIQYAGVVKSARKGLSDETYIQVHEIYGEDESPLFKHVRRLSSTQDSVCLEIIYPDGARDLLVLREPGSGTLFAGNDVVTDGHAVLLRFDRNSQLKDAVRIGGNLLRWKNKEVTGAIPASFRGRIQELYGDLSGDRSRSAFLISPEKNWPQNLDIFRRRTLIADFNHGHRSESYTIADARRRPDGAILLELANAPFFADVIGTVFSCGTVSPNEFSGSATGKGGFGQTEYLTGSKVVFPKEKVAFTLRGGKARNQYFLEEKVNLSKLGIRPGSPFVIHPDWRNASVRISLEIRNKQ